MDSFLSYVISRSEYSLPCLACCREFIHPILLPSLPFPLYLFPELCSGILLTRKMGALVFAGGPGLSKYLFVKPRLGQNIASRALHVTVSSSILINSADMIHSAHFHLNHKDKKSCVSSQNSSREMYSPIRRRIKNN